MSHGKGRRRWWDGCGAYVTATRKVAKPARGGHLTILSLDCGHEQQAISGSRGGVGLFVICDSCVHLGGRKAVKS